MILKGLEYRKSLIIQRKIVNPSKTHKMSFGGTEWEQL